MSSHLGRWPPDEHYDVIVVGAGIAGLTVAASLADTGLHVAVLEKAASIGGTSALSGGWFAFSGTPDQAAAGIADTDRAYIDDMVTSGEGLVDIELLTAMVREQTGAYAWMREELGVRFDVVKLSSGQTVARSHHAPIDVVLGALQSRVETGRGVHVLMGCRATRLLTAGDRIVGIAAESAGESRQLMARVGVVIATGGFTRAADLIKRFAPEQADAMPYGAIGNTGDGLLMAMDAGAGYRDMELLSGTYGSHPLTTMDEHELLTAFYMGAIMVNTLGRRFVDESISYKQLGTAVLREPGQLAFEVFDSAVRAKSQAGVPLSDIGHLEAKGRLLVAGSVEKLAELMDVPPDRLRDTIDEYNNGIRDGSDAFGRTGLCNGAGYLIPVASPPFYAYPAKTLMTSTYCGLTVDALARVLTVAGRPIAGLYATGEVVGGFHGAGYVTGTALSKGLIFGRVIARGLVAEAAQTAS